MNELYVAWVNTAAILSADWTCWLAPHWPCRT